LAYVELQALRERQQTPGALFRDEVAVNRRQSAAAYSNDYSDTDTAVVRGGLRQPLAGPWRLEADAAWRQNARDFVQSLRTFPGTRSTQDRTVGTLAPRVLGRLPFGGRTVELTLGVDWEQTDYALRTAFGPQDVDQTVWGVYGQAVLPLRDDLAATVGARRAGVRNALTDYSGDHDVDDALRAGIIKEEDIPAGLIKVLGKWHATRIDRMVMDVVEASLAAGLERIAMSDRIMRAVVELREFLYQNVYFNSAAREELRKTEKIIRDLFAYVMERPEDYIKPYPAGDPAVVRAGDFIAGMTDRYAMSLYEHLFLPKSWPIL
jgi:hypothetical protein